MKKASALFDDNMKQSIRDAIGNAEHSTSGEIVPVVATASGRYDRAEGIVGLLLAISFLTVAWNLFQGYAPSTADWDTGDTMALGLPAVVGLLIVGYWLGNALATWFPVLRLPFIRQRELDAEVERAAESAFHRLRIRGTRAGTGILIYISLFEHRVVVMGDDSIAAKLSDASWREIRDTILEGLKSGDPCAGLTRGIEQCGRLLSEHFPPVDDNPDELVNELHLVD